MFSNGNGNAYRRDAYDSERMVPRHQSATTSSPKKNKRGHQRLTLKQQLEIGTRLQQVCKPPTAEYPYAAYTSGFSDAVIAKEFGFTEYAIARVRTSAIGKLQAGDAARFTKYTDNSPQRLKDRVSQLEADVMELRRRMGLPLPNLGGAMLGDITHAQNDTCGNS